MRIAAFALRWIALAPVVASCDRDPSSAPAMALAAWVDAMNAARSDPASRVRAYDLLSDAARASLSERAARATQLTGRELKPWEMLAPGRFALRFAFDPGAIEAHVTGERAMVLARGRNGERAEVPLVHEHDRWKVDLALPSVEAVGAGSPSR